MSESFFGLSDIEAVVKKLLFTQNRDPYCQTYGCFDRHHWAWKITDFPEATYQRNVYTLAWFLKNGDGYDKTLEEAVLSGLEFAVKIQHKDGSFDQAFPQEHSFGATAFLLHPLLASLKIIKEYSIDSTRIIGIENSLRRAADFLVSHEETHGFISNHLAGAAWSLIFAYQYFSEEKYLLRGRYIVQQIMEKQSGEGWFLEYDGADPGYQSLCVYYLAQCNTILKCKHLEDSLNRSTEFLSYFLHPDSSFAGEYGSRRTCNLYVGGLSILARTCKLAAGLVKGYLKGIEKGRMPNLLEIDMGNLAPMSANYILALEEQPHLVRDAIFKWKEDGFLKCFSAAGISVISNSTAYLVIGVSSGGVLKVFNKKNRTLIVDEVGYVGRLKNGQLVTTQINQQAENVEISEHKVEFKVSFFKLLDQVPTPLKMLVLRILNLSVMRSILLGNITKALLVKVLISGRKETGLELNRTIIIEPNTLKIEDRLYFESNVMNTAIEWLEKGNRFVGMHMASARYFSIEQSPTVEKEMRFEADSAQLNKLNSDGETCHSWSVELANK